MLHERIVPVELDNNGQPSASFFHTLAVWLTCVVDIRVIVEGLSGQRYTVWRADDNELGLVTVDPDETGLRKEIALSVPAGFWDLARA